MRIALILLNIASGFASALVVRLALYLALYGGLGIPHHDYSVIILGILIVILAVAIFVICLVASISLSRRGRPAAILISSIPLLLFGVPLLLLLHFVKRGP